MASFALSVVSTVLAVGPSRETISRRVVTASRPSLGRAKVINLSTNGRSSLALASVVMIWPCSMSAQAILRNKERR